MPAQPDPHQRLYQQLLTLAVLCLAASAIRAEHPQAEAHSWLEKMATAARSLNYDGTFVYRNGDWIQTMRILHRVDGQGERERLVALTGVAREVLRDDSKVTCILPDDRAVVVGKRPPPALSASFNPGENFTNSYHLSITAGDPVASRPTVLLRVEPRDNLRYGYRLSLDKSSGLLLSSELLSERGTPLEQVVYTALELDALIPDSLLEPGVSSEGFTHFTNTEPAPIASAGPSNWLVTWLPEGFSLTTQQANDPPADGRTLVEHQVYSDGLASFSVFVASLETAEQRLDGVSTMGAVSAYGRLVDGFQVTVVGEVPARTVERVGEGVEHRKR